MGTFTRCCYSERTKSWLWPAWPFTGWSNEQSRWTEPVCSFQFLDSCDSDHPLSQGTGEHGVGVGKKEYLYEELGAGTVELMKTVKKAIDPLGLFNPGKVGFLRFFVVINPEQILNILQLYPDAPGAPHDSRS